MVIDVVLTALIFTVIIIILANTIIPWMFPSLSYWWLFKKSKVDEAHRNKSTVVEEVVANEINKETGRLEKVLVRSTGTNKEGQ
jgi:hypothetical protein